MVAATGTKPQLINLDYEFTDPYLIKELTVPYFVNNHHFHNDYELVYVMESTGTRFIGDHIGNFKNGDLVFIGPNLPHAWFNDRSYYLQHNRMLARSIVTYFKQTWLHETVLNLPQSDRLTSLLNNAARGVRFRGPVVKRVAQLLVETQKASGLKRSANLLHMLHELAEAGDFKLLAGISYINSHSFKETKRMNTVYEYIIKHFSSPIKLEAVAAVANMSPNAFSRYFKIQTQKTFSNFVNEVRIGHACKLLQSADLSIAQVSYECGFNSMTNFIKFFRKVTGKNPLQYRKETLTRNALSSGTTG